MIPRNTKRLEVTLLSSRQALPRPARLYSTPSKRLNSPATATATTPTPNGDFLSFLPNASQGASSSQYAYSPSLQQFLSQKAPMVFLPNPPSGASLSSPEVPWYLNSRDLDMAGIIDACLHNFYDVQRAHEVFQLLREKVGSTLLETSLYNRFLEVYLAMATRNPDKQDYWVDEAWKLYSIMEGETEEVKPNQGTYGVMLMFCERFKPTETRFTNRRTDFLLSNIVKRKISVLNIMGSPIFDNAAEVTNIAHNLAVDAVKLKFTDIVNELGHVSTNSQSSEDGSGADNFPDVMPVLKNSEVPFNLSDLRRHLAQLAQSRGLLENELYARQKQLENSVYEMAQDSLLYKKEALEARGVDTFIPRDDQLKKWMWDWHVKLTERFTQDQAKLKQGLRVLGKTDADVEPYLLMIKPEMLARLVVLEVFRMNGTGGVVEGMKTARACIAVGKAVEVQHKLETCKNNRITTLPTVDSHNLFDTLGYQELYRRRTAAAQTAIDNEGWTAEWSQTLRARVGAVLLDRLLSIAEINLEQYDLQSDTLLAEPHPAFYQSYEYVRGKKLGVIKIHPSVMELIAKNNIRQTIHPRHFPMLVKPQPWISYNKGGYLYSRTSAMRFKESYEQETYLKAATEQGHLEVVFAGLDILGSTAWRINREIFEVIINVWNSGIRKGKIPPAKYDVPEPVLSEEESKNLQARSHHIIRHRAWAQENANNHSMRCSVNYKMEIARAFLNDQFYLPHNLDFRGRAYPIPSHLNHMGDDLSRSMLMFADAKPLGERGLRWLKIHAANLYGYDKARFDERVEWVDENMANIRESAENPLEGSGWWTKADDPWQFLSACLELKKAFELEDPTTYECALPVHQDGTCNGLQHYAALGGDVQGAQQVNLAAADKPSDVYTFISLKVQDHINQAAEKGEPMAIRLKDKISRKVVKQTVMTTVYGVTYVGARDQIDKQLRERSGLEKQECWGAAAYIAKKLLSTIGDTFRGATGIQDWLNVCAKLISKSVPAERLGMTTDEEGQLWSNVKYANIKSEQMTPVIWTTALGLPIVQPYRKAKKKQVNTALQSVFISDPLKGSEVNTQKQASAFPPNFIHSLDATHMLLTAIECHKRGLTFASIHDSYWTHAADIDVMAEAIRETFIELHQSDILNKLEQEFRARYANHYIACNEISMGGKFSKFVQKLHKAGSRLYMPTDMNPDIDIPILKPLVELTDDPSRWAVFATRRKWSGEMEGSEGEEGEDALDTAVRAEAEDAENGGKRVYLVRVTDLFPPLPAKGEFEVSTIKSSPYFFS